MSLTLKNVVPSFPLGTIKKISMKLIKVTVDAKAAGMKIDKAILACGVDLPRKEIRRILDKGGITCNGKRVFVASQTVKHGDKITLTYHPALSSKEKVQASLKEEDILYWKHDVLAVNKAPGIASVPTVSNQTPYVKKLLLPLVTQKGINPETLTACHRLDKETSGVLLFAFGQDKAHWIMEQFKKHEVQKVYYALCYGIPKTKHWTVDCHLSGIDKKTGMVKIVRSGGYSSFSSFQVIAVSKAHHLSLVRIEPRTGRSHQIRVHLLHSQHPIVGDKKYILSHIRSLPPSLAEMSLHHHFLHAASLEFSPDKEQKRVTLTAPFPSLFHSFIKKSQMDFLIQDPLFFK